MRSFVFEDMFCVAEENRAVLSATVDSMPLLNLFPAKGIGAAQVVCFATGFAMLPQLRRALIDCRNTLLAVEQGQAAGPRILAAAAHANTPLATLGRIERWAAEGEMNGRSILGGKEKPHAIRV